MTTATTNLAQSRQFLQSLTGRKIDEEDLPGAHSLGAHAADAFSVSTSVTGGSAPTAATSMRLVVKGAEPGAKVQIVADSVVDGFKTLFVLGSGTPDSQGVIQLNTSRINGYFENLRAQQIVDGKVGQFTDVQSEAGGPLGAIHWDHVAPTVKVSGPFRDPAAASDDALNVKFSFSEAPVGFSEKSVVVTGGTLKNLKASDASGLVYTGDFIPSSPSAAKVTVKVKSGGYTDAAGNAGEGSPLLSVLLEKNNLAVTGGAAPASVDSVKTAVADTVAPVKPAAPAKAATVEPAFKPLTVTTAEPDGFWPTNAPTMSFQVSGGKPGAPVTILAADFLDGVKGSFTLGTGVPNAKGVLTLDTTAFNGRFGYFRASQAVAGKPDQVVEVTKPSGGSFGGVQWDHVLPWVEIIGPDADKLAAGKPFTVKFLFGEAPAAFSEKNVVVTGGTLTDVKPTTEGGMLYTGTFKPSSAQGAKVSLQIKSGAFSDLAGNPGQASEVLMIALPQSGSAASAEVSTGKVGPAQHSTLMAADEFAGMAKNLLAQTGVTNEAPATTPSLKATSQTAPDSKQPIPLSEEKVTGAIKQVLGQVGGAGGAQAAQSQPLSAKDFDALAKQILVARGDIVETTALASPPKPAPEARHAIVDSQTNAPAKASVDAPAVAALPKAALEPMPASVADSAKKAAVVQILANGVQPDDGMFHPGDKLKVVLKGVDGLDPASVQVQWLSGKGAVLASSKGDSFTLPKDGSLVGQDITAKVSYQDQSKVQDSVTSAQHAVRWPNQHGVITIEGGSDGVCHDGDVLTAKIVDGDGLSGGKVSYSWKVDGVEKGTGESYTVTKADKGHLINVVAVYKDAADNVEFIWSDLIKSAGAPGNHDPEGQFGIGDYNAKVGSVITADIGNVKDADGIVEGSRNVKWYAEDLDRSKTLISSDHFQGGDSSKLIVSADLLYKRITATMEYTDKKGNHESVDASSPALVSWDRSYEVGKLSFAGAAKPVEHAQLIAREPGSSVYILDVNGDGKITSADATSYITSLDSKGGMRINIDGGKGTAKLLSADDALWAKFGLPRVEWGSADGSKGMAAADGKAAVAGGDFWTSTPGQSAGSHLVWSKSGGDHGAAGAYLQADAAPPLDVSRLHYNVFHVSVMPT
ncbi:Ig-like domain-containing protein [Herbaspirillum seropedicae]|uniref:Ig-like domain-containing protein n=1 Tax=Herbaspirillum seropedicae TaxID=964 RepID=UPI003FCCF1B5